MQTQVGHSEFHCSPLKRTHFFLGGSVSVKRTRVEQKEGDEFMPGGVRGVCTRCCPSLQGDGIFIEMFPKADEYSIALPVSMHTGSSIVDGKLVLGFSSFFNHSRN